jgi:hypothetical protein
MELIDLRGNAPDRLATFIGKPESRAGVLKKRIMLRIEMKFPFQQQGRYPMGIVPVDAIRQIVEFAPLCTRLDWHNVHARTSATFHH